MKNRDIINSINKLCAFVERQRNIGMSLLSVNGQFVIKHNSKILNEHYKVYEETLKDIKEEYKIGEVTYLEAVDNEAKNKIKELLDIDVDIELKTITESDFKDGATFDDISLLEFIIKEEN